MSALMSHNTLESRETPYIFNLCLYQRIVALTTIIQSPLPSPSQHSWPFPSSLSTIYLFRHHSHFLTSLVTTVISSLPSPLSSPHFRHHCHPITSVTTFIPSLPSPLSSSNHSHSHTSSVTTLILTPLKSPLSSSHLFRHHSPPLPRSATSRWWQHDRWGNAGGAGEHVTCFIWKCRILFWELGQMIVAC